MINKSIDMVLWKSKDKFNSKFTTVYLGEKEYRSLKKYVNTFKLYKTSDVKKISEYYRGLLIVRVKEKSYIGFGIGESKL